MMFGVIAVVEKQPVVDFSVAAHAPRNRLVGVRSVVPVVAIQVTKTMAEIPKWQEIQHESPVNEVNRSRWYDDRHDEERRCKRSQLEIAPEIIAVLPFPQVLADRIDVVAKETQKNIAPRIFGFAVVAVVTVNRTFFGIQRAVGIIQKNRRRGSSCTTQWVSI